MALGDPQICDCYSPFTLVCQCCADWRSCLFFFSVAVPLTVVEKALRDRHITNVRALSRFVHKSHTYVGMPDTLWELLLSIVYEIVPNPSRLGSSSCLRSLHVFRAL